MVVALRWLVTLAVCLALACSQRHSPILTARPDTLLMQLLPDGPGGPDARSGPDHGPMGPGNQHPPLQARTIPRAAALALAIVQTIIIAGAILLAVILPTRDQAPGRKRPAR